MSDLPSTGTTLGAYTLDAVIGAGGVATVFRATHRVLGSTHAIKLLHLPAPSLRRRLLLEGKLQAQIRHPHIVPVTDTVLWHGLPGLVMEHIDGPDLEAWTERAPLPLASLDRLARGLFGGVAALHRAGYAHRDLKPANVLMQHGPDGWIPRLADCGLARRIQRRPTDAHTRTGVSMGTPAYMAPEQVHDARDADHRADVWSLGCILYELATGHRPFDGPDAFATMTAVTASTPSPPASLRADLPASMASAIGGALVKDRSQRFASIREMAAAWFRDEPTGAPLPAPRHHLGVLASRPRRRQPTHLEALVRLTPRAVHR